MTGSLLVDTEAFSRTYDQSEWKNAFGPSGLAARIDPDKAGGLYLYKWYFGKPAPADQSAPVIVPNVQFLYNAAATDGHPGDARQLPEGLLRRRDHPVDAGVAADLVRQPRLLPVDRLRRTRRHDRGLVGPEDDRSRRAGPPGDGHVAVRRRWQAVPARPVAEDRPDGLRDRTVRSRCTREADARRGCRIPGMSPVVAVRTLGVVDGRGQALAGAVCADRGVLPRVPGWRSASCAGPADGATGCRRTVFTRAGARGRGRRARGWWRPRCADGARRDAAPPFAASSATRRRPARSSGPPPAARAWRARPVGGSAARRRRRGAVGPGRRRLERGCSTRWPASRRGRGCRRCWAR